ncbi:MAG: hypothetical protein IJY18_05340 [Clostridia bacterium]|nr:hypothetical protein [Clostridia bacterium]
MLYDKWIKEKFSDSLFKDPPTVYRGAPFWAWNSTLEPKALTEQIDIFHEMGFGGFNMHVRQGLETEYLGKDFFDAVRACTERAEKHGMLAWLYDEDRWPSGAAGGMVTKTVKYRIKNISMYTEKKAGAVSDWHDAIESGAPVFVAAFSVEVDNDGLLVSYKRVGEDEECPNKRYFYSMTARGGEPRFNFQSYVDTFSKEAIDCFKEVTYEAYAREVGDKFGKSIPAIFTDEPQSIDPKELKSGSWTGKVEYPWTWDMPETFRKAYGFDLVERLPEVFFRCKDESDRSPRYFYYRHLSERFAEAFVDNLGEWCENNGIIFTGHLMCEDDLTNITRRCFDPMFMYKRMQLPGIDVLFDRRLFATAKQCNSVVRQMGKEGMLSELYGVTGWDYDFRGHKSQGDWQACLGVTVRVPHLSWQTMKGEGKRDYPASISYQSPWYKEYKMIEDHFARVNTALTRGKAACRIAVVHPIESFYMHYASIAESMSECTELNSQFLELCNWLLLGSVDFDYIGESLLPELCKNPTSPLKVGEMEYDTIILDNCENLRPYTIECLEAFARSGGKVIVTGKAPAFSNAMPSERAKALSEMAHRIPRTKSDILEALSDSVELTVRYRGGAPTSELLSTRRKDGECDWIFVCNAYKPELAHIPTRRDIEISVKGLYRPQLYNTIAGSVEKIEFKAERGATKIYASIFDFDSLLLKLDKIDEEAFYTPEPFKLERKLVKTPYINSYRLSEPNVLLLDMPEWSIDGGYLHQPEELMRIDERVRQKLGLPLKRTKAVQPWAVASAPENNELYLRFTFRSEIEYEGAMLAIENIEKTDIVFNGVAVDNTPVGYYVDKEIKTCPISTVVKGENVLELKIPFGVRTDAENCFILGDFGVDFRGREAYIKKLPEDIAYGDVVHQGLAFYGANIIYDSELDLDEDSDILFEISYYRGALLRVAIDGEDVGAIWKSPFRLEVPCVKAGHHKVTYTLFGNRYNTFTALHSLIADKKDVYMGPDFWRSTGFGWSYEYNTRPMGILKAPDVFKITKN